MIPLLKSFRYFSSTPFLGVTCSAFISIPVFAASTSTTTPVPHASISTTLKYLTQPVHYEKRPLTFVSIKPPSKKKK